MSIGEFCNREVVVAERNDSVLEAAHLMRQHHVGALVVVAAASNGTRVPVGIVTDRDLVIEVLAPHLDPESVRLGDILIEPLCTVRERDGVFETMRRMREHGVRRVPVVDERGGLQGIVAVDDLLAVLAEEMNEFAKLITHEHAIEHRKRK